MDPVEFNVKVASDMGIKFVPDMFIQPDSVQDSFVPHNEVCEGIPVIDLGGLEDESRHDSTMAAIASACQEWGFFQIINHGIPLWLVEKAHKLSREFFDLPQEEKDSLVQDTANPFSAGYGHRLVANATNWQDVLFHYLLPLSIKNVESWPTKPAAYRETMDMYGNEVLKLTNRLLDIFSKLLGLKPRYLKEVFEDTMLNVRLNFYPACPEPKLVLGLRAHSDPNVMTVVVQDDVGGVQVKKENRWYNVKPVSGALVVNLGDSMQVVSNGRFQSVEHRAVTNQGAARLSVAMFRHPSMVSKIGPAPELVDASHPPLYPTIDYAAYRESFHKKATDGKVLSKMGD